MSDAVFGVKLRIFVYLLAQIGGGVEEKPVFTVNTDRG